MEYVTLTSRRMKTTHWSLDCEKAGFHARWFQGLARDVLSGDVDERDFRNMRRYWEGHALMSALHALAFLAPAPLRFVSAPIANW